MSLSTVQLLPHPRQQVVDWFNRPGAVRRLTPGLMPMTVVQEASNLADGMTVFDMPGGLQWRAQHDPGAYIPGTQFVDDAVSEPFRSALRWRHLHGFADATGADGSAQCLVTDDVSTRVPAVALRSVFAYRHRVLADDFAAAHRLASYLGLSDVAGNPIAALPKLTIAVSGASGTIGTALCALLTTTGHTVIELVRGEAGPGQRKWDTNDPAEDLLDGVDALVHLAGAPIAGRFTDAHLKAVRESRVGPTRKLAELIAAGRGPKTVVSASAVGFYGKDRGTEVLDESAGSGDGVLSEIVSEWEAAWQPARDAGARVTTVRTGLVQSGGGGLLPLLAGVTFTGLGGPLGDGQQWFPWIAVDDLLDIYHRALLDPNVSGPVNAVAPNGMTNKAYTKTLARVLHRPAVIPVPKAGPAAMLGWQGAEELALANQRAVGSKLEELGHVFRFPKLTAALRHELLR
ncbi:TIGR01777 family oxidoreductase [Corynebacterium sp. TAE3-ERU12]|uniref:TIGR01777 family oxidoreductase n=1 Tax=Corynebacterium sp. TAE3-ERU12 TaxID=2849491 RepID=UPI001C49742E|nr:TIGR01777 family oxidoreductase [Corynebacterium sp. TAE3-ERU12]MBV7295713.1 TIGR01777 family oxidoreductase [Corynebacterium sp. TAE3-ERU12]